MRVLLTGAGGFSGRFLAGRLVAHGHEVHAVSRRPPATTTLEAWGGACRVVIADLSRPDPLPEACEAIVHTASTSPMPGVTEAEMERDNIAATERLIAHARASRARCFVFFSSLSLYGKVEVSEVDETTLCREPDFYGRTKQAGEALLAAAAPQLSGLALRLPAIIGPGARRNWLATTLARIRRGEPVSIFNPDAPFNNAVHIADLADLVLALLEQPWSGFDAVTLGAEGTLPIREIVMRLMRGEGRRVPVEIRPAPGSSFTVSSARAKARYCYRPMEIGMMIERFAREQEKAPAAAAHVRF